ncbi:hypothetical protein ABZV67_37410 [Streptomyces sp. NPDC005065]|uniref:hypothetical protein n=1 Tax=Streptomyces sp. NPDC005065 TaxID=3154461 RepID=UPI0033A5B10C
MSCRRGQPQVLLGELVDAVDQVVVAELFDLLPEMNAGLLPQLAVLGSEPLDLLAGKKQVGLLAGSGDLPSVLLVLVALGSLVSPRLSLREQN